MDDDLPLKIYEELMAEYMASHPEHKSEQSIGDFTVPGTEPDLHDPAEGFLAPETEMAPALTPLQQQLAEARALLDAIRADEVQSSVFHDAGPDDWTTDEEIAAMVEDDLDA